MAFADFLVINYILIEQREQNTLKCIARPTRFFTFSSSRGEKPISRKTMLEDNPRVRRLKLLGAFLKASWRPYSACDTQSVAFMCSQCFDYWITGTITGKRKEIQIYHRRWKRRVTLDSREIFTSDMIGDIRIIRKRPISTYTHNLRTLEYHPKYNTCFFNIGPHRDYT